MSSRSAPYARQFLGQFAKPDVDQISGLRPAIAIQQKSTGWNPRSTVGTVTGIYDFLRVLYARAGQAALHEMRQADHRPDAGRDRRPYPGPVRRHAVLILAPVVRGQKGEHLDLLDDLRRRGFVRARIDGQVVHLERRAETRPQQPARHRSRDRPAHLPRGRAIADCRGGGGGVDTRRRHVIYRRLSSGERRGDERAKGQAEPGDRETEGRIQRSPSLRVSKSPSLSGFGSLLQVCLHACGIGFDPPSPQLFSFNSPSGMCLNCDGMGTTYEFDPKLLVPDPSLPFLTPCVAPMRTRPGLAEAHFPGRRQTRRVRSESALAATCRQGEARAVVWHGQRTHHLRMEIVRPRLEAWRHV